MKPASRWIAVLALSLLAACASSNHKDSSPESQPQPEATPQDPTWREDPKPAKPADPKVETQPKQPTKPVDPKVETPTKPADPKVETQPKQPTKPVDPKVETPTKPADPKVETPPKQPTKPVDPKVETPPKQPKNPQPPAKTAAELEHERLADEYVAAVKTLLPGLEGSKAWKQFEGDYRKFEDKYDKVKETRKAEKPNKNALEKEWAECIKYWYEARYSLALFTRLHSPAQDFVAVFLYERADVLALSDAQLQSDDCRHSQAASELAATPSTELNRFRTDALKYDLTAGAVHESKDHSKTFGDAKKKFEDAAAGKFDEKDLKRLRD
ncbi:MAG: hypothetical protein IPP14_03915 [Planctomycetes bacterium]|nr:hypothetical protein [Planctomycetota bacterium]